VICLLLSGRWEKARAEAARATAEAAETRKGHAQQQAQITEMKQQHLEQAQQDKRKIEQLMEAQTSLHDSPRSFSSVSAVVPLSAVPSSRLSCFTALRAGLLSSSWRGVDEEGCAASRLELRFRSGASPDVLRLQSNRMRSRNHHPCV
jgi:hypothetical protein